MVQQKDYSNVINKIDLIAEKVYNDFIKEMIKVNKSSTLREMYYISEGWDLAKFHTQDESNLLAEDLEVITGCMREDLKLRHEEDGARVIGNLTIEEMTRNNTKKKIH